MFISARHVQLFEIRKLKPPVHSLPWWGFVYIISLLYSYIIPKQLLVFADSFYGMKILFRSLNYCDVASRVFPDHKASRQESISVSWSVFFGFLKTESWSHGALIVFVKRIWKMFSSCRHVSKARKLVLTRLVFGWFYWLVVLPFLQTDSFDFNYWQT